LEDLEHLKGTTEQSIKVSIGWEKKKERIGLFWLRGETGRRGTDGGEFNETAATTWKELKVRY